MKKRIHDFLESMPTPFYTNELKNWWKFWKSIKEIFAIILHDVQQLNQDFIPSLASEQYLYLHGESLGIPCFSFDTEQTYRNRVRNMSSWLDEQGSLKQFRYVLDAVVGIDRWRFTVFNTVGKASIDVYNIMPEERLWLSEFFDATLDPDIEIEIVDWALPNFPDRVDYKALVDLGGSSYLQSYINAIEKAPIITHCELYPDYAFTIGVSLVAKDFIGADNAEEVLLIWCDASQKSVIRRYLDAYLLPGFRYILLTNGVV